MALLAAEALDLDDGQALDADSCSASFTSSSLNGLMIASIFFMGTDSSPFVLAPADHFRGQGQCERVWPGLGAGGFRVCPKFVQCA
jgi:hypothetical protein